MANYKDLDKVLDLVVKTGDKVIIMSENQEPMVLMSFRDYDHLLLSAASVNQLTEQQLMDKINRDIAIWKSVQTGANYNVDEFKVDDISTVASPKADQGKSPAETVTAEETVGEEEDKYYIEPVD